MTDRAATLPAAVAIVGSGGFVGAVLRHGVTVAAPTTALGTLIVNVLGSFALGLVLSDSRFGRWLSGRLRLLLGTGLLSSFTTYSTFALATTELAPLWAVAYVGANYGLAIGGVALAHLIARRWIG